MLFRSLDGIQPKVEFDATGAVTTDLTGSVSSKNTLGTDYGMSKASIARRVRAGEFGETINAGPRTHLVTAAGVAKFDADHTGPAHDGEVGTYRPRRRTQHRDPGPI